MRKFFWHNFHHFLFNKFTKFQLQRRIWSTYKELCRQQHEILTRFQKQLNRKSKFNAQLFKTLLSDIKIIPSAVKIEQLLIWEILSVHERTWSRKNGTSRRWKSHSSLVSKHSRKYSPTIGFDVVIVWSSNGEAFRTLEDRFFKWSSKKVHSLPLCLRMQSSNNFTEQKVLKHLENCQKLIQNSNYVVKKVRILVFELFLKLWNIRKLL